MITMHRWQRQQKPIVHLEDVTSSPSRCGTTTYASVMRGVLVRTISQVVNMKSLRARKRTKAVTYSEILCTPQDYYHDLDHIITCWDKHFLSNLTNEG